MTTETVLSVQDGNVLGTVRQILKTLLEENIVDELLVPLEVPSADRVTPMLVHDPMQLDTANPLAPVMRIQTAAVLTRLEHSATGNMRGAVLRPCELRAVIELAKVGRIDRGQWLLMGIDCLGTYEPQVYAQIANSARTSPTDEMLRWARQGPIAPYRLRQACQMCEHFTPEHADITIGLIGMNIRNHIIVHTRADIAAKLGLTTAPANGREKAITRLSAIRHHRREQAIADASQIIGDVSALFATLAECDTCGECLEACPFCGTAAFMPRPTHTPRGYRARDWGNDEALPARPLNLGTFGDLIALGRRAASCVNCGMCESACEKHVPLTAIQATLGRKLQEAYHYVPGQDLNARLPWATA